MPSKVSDISKLVCDAWYKQMYKSMSNAKKTTKVKQLL